MATHQAPPSLGFFRQEHWSGLPFPSPMHESKKWSEVAQLCLTLRDPMDCSLPGSTVHGISQARVYQCSLTHHEFSNYCSEGKTARIQQCPAVMEKLVVRTAPCLELVNWAVYRLTQKVWLVEGLPWWSSG